MISHNFNLGTDTKEVENDAVRHENLEVAELEFPFQTSLTTLYQPFERPLDIWCRYIGTSLATYVCCQYALKFVSLNSLALPLSLSLNYMHLCCFCFDMGVSKNRGAPKSSSLTGFSIINHPVWGTPISWKHPYLKVVFMCHINGSCHRNAKPGPLRLWVSKIAAVAAPHGPTSCWDW